MKPEDEQRSKHTLPKRAGCNGNPNTQQEEGSRIRAGAALARGSGEVFLKGATLNAGFRK